MERLQKIRGLVLPAEGRVQNSKNIFNKNRKNKKVLDLVVQRDRVNCWIFIHKIPQIKKSKKEAGQKIRKVENNITSSSCEKMVSKPASKQKNSDITVLNLKSNGCREKKRGKKTYKKVEAKK